MSVELEILSAIYTLYENGELNSEFDKTTNKMVPASTLVAIMQDVKSLLPEELEPEQAAEAMRALPEEDKNTAITSSDKVIDMRKHFAEKMSRNNGARGLIKKFLVANEMGDTEEVIKTMQEFMAFEEGDQ